MRKMNDEENILKKTESNKYREQKAIKPRAVLIQKVIKTSLNCRMMSVVLCIDSVHLPWLNVCLALPCLVIPCSKQKTN